MLNNTNKAKKTCYKFFAYMGLYGVPRTRTRERNNDLFTLVLERERERESTQLFGTTK